MGTKRRKIQVITSRLKSFTYFFDTFTSGFKLGWQSIRSGWSASSGTATANTDNYPISVVKMSSHNVTSETVSDNSNSGDGVALWVSDSSNWWGVASKQTDTYSTFYYNCNCGTSYYNCNCGTSYYQCNCSTNGPYLGYLAIYNSYYYYYTYTCQTCSSYSCQTCSSYSCQTCSGTNTINNYYLKLYRSVSGTVSEITSVTLSAIAKSIRVITNGLSITGRAYSDAGFASQTGSDLTHTATGATTTNLHGILIAPSTQNQNYTIDSFQSTSN